MIIKTTPISSSHGAGVISYALNKEDAQLVKMQHLHYTSYGFPPDDSSVYNQMMMHQKFSGKKCKEPFLRIEVCPPPDKTEDWTMEEWQQLCEETLAELARQGIDLRNSQLICCLHRDSGKLHLHIIANRIDMDGKLTNAWQCKNKSIAAANAIANAHGWSLASDVKPQLKNEIRNEALEVLANMEKFDIKDFFANMRARGYIIQDRWSKGKCVGYSIGKDADVLFKSSQLTGRDLMPSRIEETWKRLHATPMVSYIYTTDYKGKIPFDIPKALDDVINHEIEVPDEIYDDDDLDWDEEWDYELADRPRVARGAAAILVGLMLPTGNDGPAVGGGGGGVQDELSRWDGLPAERQDEYIRCARRAAEQASEYYRPQKVTKRRGRGIR